MSNAEIIMAALAIATPIISVVVAIIVARRNKDKDVKNEAEQLGTMKSDIAYIKAGIDDLKANDKAKDERLDHMNEAIVRIEERLESHIKDKSIHSRAKGAKKS